jgi:hypothetical protein
MKKFSFQFALLITIIATTICSCTKKEVVIIPNHLPPSPTGSHTTIDTVYKTIAGNVLTFTIEGNAINHVDSVSTIRIDSNGITTQLQAYASYTSGSTTFALIIAFTTPGNIVSPSSFNIPQGPAAIAFESNVNSSNNYIFYISANGYPGSAGVVTITTNDAANKKITGTFDNVIAVEPNSAGNVVHINQGLYSISY